MVKSKEVSVIPTPKSDSLLVTVPEAASLAGLTVWQIRGLIATRQLPIVKIGRRFHIRRATLIRWAERAEDLVA
jgi:excisionase family DNA binding protein